ncbi:hypothetical protein GQ44DRAFT_769010 [Phaeosphaeriaceae sp. PMI808]|nr:hypothetical protein GQ44DRAFT_769010 [Phaeosphaeriaceae sp. PMI808]
MPVPNLAHQKKRSQQLPYPRSSFFMPAEVRPLAIPDSPCAYILQSTKKEPYPLPKQQFAMGGRPSSRPYRTYLGVQNHYNPPYGLIQVGKHGSFEKQNAGFTEDRSLTSEPSHRQKVEYSGTESDIPCHPVPEKSNLTRRYVTNAHPNDHSGASTPTSPETPQPSHMARKESAELESATRILSIVREYSTVQADFDKESIGFTQWKAANPRPRKSVAPWPTMPDGTVRHDSKHREFHERKQQINHSKRSHRPDENRRDSRDDRKPQKHSIHRSYKEKYEQHDCSSRQTMYPNSLYMNVSQRRSAALNALYPNSAFVDTNSRTRESGSRAQKTNSKKHHPVPIVTKLSVVGSCASGTVVMEPRSNNLYVANAHSNGNSVLGAPSPNAGRQISWGEKWGSNQNGDMSPSPVLRSYQHTFDATLPKTILGRWISFVQYRIRNHRNSCSRRQSL